MKRNFWLAILLPILSICMSSQVFASQRFVLDSQHSYVRWQISHFGFSSPSGKWMANGTLDLDKDKPEDSKVDILIDVADVITGIPELDKHLRGKLFFDTEKFPTATFVSTKIKVTGKDTAKVTGTLTIRGVSKPVTLDVKLNKVAKNPINDKETAGFSATTIIKRSTFGMNALLPGLGDEVKLTIEVEAYKSVVNEAKDAAKKRS